MTSDRNKAPFAGRPGGPYNILRTADMREHFVNMLASDAYYDIFRQHHVHLPELRSILYAKVGTVGNTKLTQKTKEIAMLQMLRDQRLIFLELVQQRRAALGLPQLPIHAVALYRPQSYPGKAQRQRTTRVVDHSPGPLVVDVPDRRTPSPARPESPLAGPSYAYSPQNLDLNTGYAFETEVIGTATPSTGGSTDPRLTPTRSRPTSSYSPFGNVTPSTGGHTPSRTTPVRSRPVSAYDRSPDPAYDIAEHFNTALSPSLHGASPRKMTSAGEHLCKYDWRKGKCVRTPSHNGSSATPKVAPWSITCMETALTLSRPLPVRVKVTSTLHHSLHDTYDEHASIPPSYIVISPMQSLTRRRHVGQRHKPHRRPLYRIPLITPSYPNDRILPFSFASSSPFPSTNVLSSPFNPDEHLAVAIPPHESVLEDSSTTDGTSSATPPANVIVHSVITLYPPERYVHDVPTVDATLPRLSNNPGTVDIDAYAPVTVVVTSGGTTTRASSPSTSIDTVGGGHCIIRTPVTEGSAVVTIVAPLTATRSPVQHDDAGGLVTTVTPMVGDIRMSPTLQVSVVPTLPSTVRPLTRQHRTMALAAHAADPLRQQAYLVQCHAAAVTAEASIGTHPRRKRELALLHDANARFEQWMCNRGRPPSPPQQSSSDDSDV